MLQSLVTGRPAPMLIHKYGCMGYVKEWKFEVSEAPLKETFSEEGGII